MNFNPSRQDAENSCQTQFLTHCQNHLPLIVFDVVTHRPPPLHDLEPDRNSILVITHRLPPWPAHANRSPG